MKMTKPELIEFLKSKGYTKCKETVEEYYTDETWSRLAYNTYKLSVLIRNNLSEWIYVSFLESDGVEKIGSYINWLVVVDNELGIFNRITV